MNTTSTYSIDYQSCFGTPKSYVLRYRYAFNGKEQNPEWNGVGAMYDYGFRIYDPRIAKFLSVDPLAKSFPFYTPYQFSANTPISAIDLDKPGATVVGYDNDGNYITLFNLPDGNIDQLLGRENNEEPSGLPPGEGRMPNSGETRDAGWFETLIYRLSPEGFWDAIQRITKWFGTPEGEDESGREVWHTVTLPACEDCVEIKDKEPDSPILLPDESPAVEINQLIVVPQPRTGTTDQTTYKTTYYVDTTYYDQSGNMIEIDSTNNEVSRDVYMG